jgi:predicted pyridoxine 5'-phosphate oxidase superfamily flavin-nucleotide-binding protein
MSSGAERDELPQPLIDYLSGGRLVVGATIDAEGRPYTMVMNSAVAVDARTIRFALDHRTHTLVNLHNRPAMSIEIVGDGFIFGVRGTARIIKERMDHAPIASALAQLDVESVKSDLPPGVQVHAPRFEWGALEQYMSGVEPAMFDELREGQ